ncbi:MAG: hypothetical protein ABIQ85_04440 [Cypionkella sp.]
MTQVFVLCTGRCGSTTFAAACQHATNFTAAHESRTYRLGPARFAYPPNHIEVDNRLAWFTGRLDDSFGEAPFYVHLTRNAAETASSFAARMNHGLMKAYRTGILPNLLLREPQTTAAEVGSDLVETLTANIRLFLRNKPRVMQVRLETMTEDFPKFWHWIGAEGDLSAAMAEFQTRHNATK